MRNFTIEQMTVLYTVGIIMDTFEDGHPLKETYRLTEEGYAEYKELLRSGFTLPTREVDDVVDSLMVINGLDN